MSEKFMNYIGPIINDVEYHGLGEPSGYLDIHLNTNLPFRLYCKMDDENWETVTDEERLGLIEQLKERKSKHSRSDYWYYTYDFYIASLGGR